MCCLWLPNIFNGKNICCHTAASFPNTTSISALITELYKNYIIEIKEDSKDKDKETKKKASLILMLSFLTGNKIQEWLRLQSKRAKNLNARQQIKQSNGQYYLRSKFSILKIRILLIQRACSTKQFIWTSRSRIHLLNLCETVTPLRKRTFSNI